MPPSLQEQAPMAPEVKYAGFWLRFLAIFLDGIVLNVVSYIIFGSKNTGTTAYYSITIIVLWLYYAIMESSPWQATLGKKTMGIKVTDLNGNRISFGRATGRYFAKFISTIILFIGYIMAGFTQKKQALHDMIAGTLVVRGR